MSDIVERLRNDQPIAPDDIRFEAADTIERLRAEIEQLWTALSWIEDQRIRRRIDGR